MTYCIAKPSLPLSKFIKNYWTIEDCIPVSRHHTQRIVPSGLLELIFYLGDKPVSKNHTRTISENTVITGHLSDYYDIDVSGKLSLFSILFKPHGLSMFFDIPLNELYNQNVPLKHLFKHDTVELENKLFEAHSFAERIKLVERFFLMLLNKSTSKDNFNRIEQCIDIINQTRGVVDISFLASKACYSRKQFERVFAQYVGSSPKQFLKTIRFQNTVDEKAKHKSANLTDLTYRCGYFDQSHMINDFKKLTGLTPKQYFDTCEPYSDYFNGY